MFYRTEKATFRPFTAAVVLALAAVQAQAQTADWPVACSSTEDSVSRFDEDRNDVPFPRFATFSETESLSQCDVQFSSMLTAPIIQTCGAHSSITVRPYGFEPEFEDTHFRRFLVVNGDGEPELIGYGCDVQQVDQSISWFAVYRYEQNPNLEGRYWDRRIHEEGDTDRLSRSVMEAVQEWVVEYETIIAEREAERVRDGQSGLIDPNN